MLTVEVVAEQTAGRLSVECERLEFKKKNLLPCNVR